jgi:energy-coupling factor transport system permease protein
VISARPGPAGGARRSWLRDASPLPKLAWLVASLPLVLLTYEAGVLVALLGAAIVLVVAGGAARTASRTVLAMWPIAAAILVLQALAPVACAAAACVPYGRLGPITLYVEGLSFALVLVLRLLVLEVAAVALLATIHPSDLFAALRALRLPYQVALMAMLSLRLIPELEREARDVHAAQRARAMRGSGLASLVPTLVPVIAASFDRMTTLVISLEARGLGSGPRTSYRRVTLGRAGMIAILVAAATAVGGSWLAATHWGRVTASIIVLPAPLAFALVAAAAAGFVVAIAWGLRGLARG